MLSAASEESAVFCTKKSYCALTGVSNFAQQYHSQVVDPDGFDTWLEPITIKGGGGLE